MITAAVVIGPLLHLWWVDRHQTTSNKSQSSITLLFIPTETKFEDGRQAGRRRTSFRRSNGYANSLLVADLITRRYCAA